METIIAIKYNKNIL